MDCGALKIPRSYFYLIKNITPPRKEEEKKREKKKEKTHNEIRTSATQLSSQTHYQLDYGNDTYINIIIKSPLCFAQIRRLSKIETFPFPVIVE